MAGQKASVIIWDEAPMSSRFLLEALDRCLKDIRQIEEPFGGLVMVLAGDFRQTLPVVSHASPSQIIEVSLKKSVLWP
ncbi:MAG: hypothetical protein RLZZ69_3286, partial [Cyanobacteriota bacterium]